MKINRILMVLAIACATNVFAKVGEVAGGTFGSYPTYDGYFAPNKLRHINSFAMCLC